MTERKLLMAVICQAVTDYISEPNFKDLSRQCENELWKKDAQRWFSSKSTKFGSFFWYCDLLDIAPEYIFRKLKEIERKSKGDKK